MKLSSADERVLRALALGFTLKSHRYLDGTKVYLLHPLDDGEPAEVAWETVTRLRELKLIDSNKKFPAATYLLTDRGRARAAEMGRDDDLPLTTSGWR